jgi:hypothetical protein
VQLSVSVLLEAVYERRELVSGALKKVEQVVDEAGHDTGMSTQNDDEAYDDHPAQCSAHGYRTRDALRIPPSAPMRAAMTTARCS